MGFETVEEGQQALLFNNQGQGTLVIGPRRVSTSYRLCLLCTPSSAKLVKWITIINNNNKKRVKLIIVL